MLWMFFGVAQCLLLFVIYYKSPYYRKNIVEDNSFDIGKRRRIQMGSIILCTIGAGIAGLQVQKHINNNYNRGGCLIALLGLSAVILIDYYRYIIPNRYLLYMCIGRIGIFFLQILNSNTEAGYSVFKSICGGCLVFLSLLCLSIITRHGLGMGDVKLLTVLAFLCGIQMAVYTLFYGVMISAAVACVLLIRKKKSMKDTIPLGPFLYGGYLCMLFLGQIP